MHIRARHDESLFTRAHRSHSYGAARKCRIYQGMYMLHCMGPGPLHESLSRAYKAFFSEASIEEKVNALRKACERHVALTKECSQGLGQDRLVYLQKDNGTLCLTAALDTFTHFIACIYVSLVGTWTHIPTTRFRKMQTGGRSHCRRSLRILAGIFLAPLFFRLQTAETPHSVFSVLDPLQRMGMDSGTLLKRMA